MIRNAKRLISYIMLLVFVFISVFANDGLAKAASLGESHTSSFRVSGNTYTLTEDVTGGYTTLNLGSNETMVLDGAGHTMESCFLMVSGNGTLVVKNLTINGPDMGNASIVIMNGSNVDIVFSGSEPIVFKSTACGNSSMGFYALRLATNAKSTITIEEGANVTFYGQDRPDVSIEGWQGYTMPVIHSENGKCLFNVSPNANFTMVNGRYTMDGAFQKYGALITKGVYMPKRFVEPGKNNPYQDDFTPHYFTIKNVVGGATISTEEYASDQESVDKDLLPTYLDSKHELVGYYTDEACTESLGATFDYSGADKTVYAKWNQTKTDVSFNSNGGSTTDTVRIDINGKVVKPANPTKSGYTFGGWFKDAACTQPYDFNAVVTGDITLFAKWIKNPSSVTTKPAPKKYSVSKTTYNANSKTLNKKVLSTFKSGKLKFTWGKVSGATGYKIYAASCKGKMKLVKTIKGASKTSTTITRISGKKLSNKENYKVYAVAYKTVSKKDYNFGKSFETHCAGTSSKKYTNVSSIKAKTKSKTLSVKKKTTMKVTTKKISSKKSLLPTSHCKRVRYFSSNDSIATVSASGKVTAKKKGKCTIYAVAMNGMRTTMKITVKNK